MVYSIEGLGEIQEHSYGVFSIFSIKNSVILSMKDDKAINVECFCRNQIDIGEEFCIYQ